MLNLPNKKVEITVPDGLTVVEYPIPDRGGMVNSVDYQKSTTSYGGYQPENGIITYSLRDTAETKQMPLPWARVFSTSGRYPGATEADLP